MTSTVTSAKDLLTHPDFVGFCACWKRDYRIPIGMPDWLRDWGLDTQARVADWCLDEPDRKDTRSPTGLGGPTPARSLTGLGWGWWITPSPKETDDLPKPCPAELNFWVQRSFDDAVAKLLDFFPAGNA